MANAAFGLNSFDHLVYLRGFEGCNVHCKHCFIPNNPKKMSKEALLMAPTHFSGFARAGDHIHIQWHGGEPTLLPSKLLRDVMDQWIVDYPEYRFSFGIQTNLTTLNDDWVALFRSHFGSTVGVSWDYGIRTLKASPSSGFEGFEKLFWENIHRLVESGISPYLVVTGTRVFFEHFVNPASFFQMLVHHGVKSAHIERLTKTGYASESWSEIGLSNLEYSEYMSRFARVYRQYILAGHDSKNPPLRLSPFDDLFESVHGLQSGRSGGSGCLSGVCDTRFHTVDANGYQKGCTALTADTALFPTHESAAPVRLVDFQGVRQARQASCDGCRFRPICSSGCLGVPKEDHSGECSGGRTLFANIEDIL